VQFLYRTHFEEAQEIQGPEFMTLRPCLESELANTSSGKFEGLTAAMKLIK
jgi:hypothetical protein